MVGGIKMQYRAVLSKWELRFCISQTSGWIQKCFQHHIHWHIWCYFCYYQLIEFHNLQHNLDQFVNFHTLSTLLACCNNLRAWAEQAEEKGRTGESFFRLQAELPSLPYNILQEKPAVNRSIPKSTSFLLRSGIIHFGVIWAQTNWRGSNSVLGNLNVPNYSYSLSLASRYESFYLVHRDVILRNVDK